MKQVQRCANQHRRLPRNISCELKKAKARAKEKVDLHPRSDKRVFDDLESSHGSQEPLPSHVLVDSRVADLGGVQRRFAPT